jgi:hypothetical protein
MTTLPNGTYNIINKSTGMYANLAESTISQYTPIIAWSDTGAGSDNSQVTFALLYHFVGTIFDLLSEVGVGVRGREFLQQIGPQCIC